MQKNVETWDLGMQHGGRPNGVMIWGEFQVLAGTFVTLCRQINSGPSAYNKGIIFNENSQLLLQDELSVDAADISGELSAFQNMPE